MKTIILLILSAFTAFAATTYPVLTDNPLRTFSGGGTNLALLNGTNVFTGTNTFTAAGFYPANNIGLRLLASAAAPTYIASMSVVSNPTNNGDYSLVTPVAELVIPPLLGSNSGVYLTVYSYRTNANTSSGNLAFWIGPNTNYLGLLSTLNTSAGNQQNFTLNNTLFQSYGSWTNQVATFTSTFVIGPTNYFDSRVTNTIFIGAYVPSGSTRTNDFIFGVAAYEAYRP